MSKIRLCFHIRSVSEGKKFFLVIKECGTWYYTCYLFIYGETFQWENLVMLYETGYAVLDATVCIAILTCLQLRISIIITIIYYYYYYYHQ